MSNFETEGTDQLTNDVDNDANLQDRSTIIDQVEEARRKQANRLRTRFFNFSVVAAGICVLVSAGTCIILLIQHALTGGVAIAFITGLSVEALGITAIVARYLFPSSGN